MFRFELYKLLTLRSTWVGATLALGLSTALALLLTKVSMDDAGVVGGPLELIQLILRAATPVPVAVAVLALTTVRSETRDGMLRLGLIAFPVRSRVLASKVAAVSALSLVLGALTAVVALAAVSFLGDFGVVSLSGWLTAIVVQVFVTQCWAMVGLVIGVLVPHLGGGVAALLLLPYAVEPLLAGLLAREPDVAALLPFRSLANAYDALGQSLAVDGGHGLVGLVPFVVVLGVAATFAVRRFSVLDA